MNIPLCALALILDLSTNWKTGRSMSSIPRFLTLDLWRHRGNESLLPHVRLAVYSSREVYNLRTKQAIDNRRMKSVSIAGSDMTLLKAVPATVFDGKPESYLSNTKNWALFKDSSNGNLYFAVRGTSTSGISAVIDNLTNLDAQEMDVFDTKASLPVKTILESAISLFR